MKDRTMSRETAVFHVFGEKFPNELNETDKLFEGYACRPDHVVSK